MKLCAFVIVATKLCYSLDSLQRTPRTVTEPAATQVSWEAWEAFLRGGNDERAGLLGKPGAQLLEVDVKEQDVFSMDPDQLDMYLDWYEKNWCLADEDIAAPKSITPSFDSRFTMLLTLHSFAGNIEPFPYLSPNTRAGLATGRRRLFAR